MKGRVVPAGSDDKINMVTIVPKSLSVIAGVIFVLAITLVGIFAPLLAPHDPLDAKLSDRLLPPFWMGGQVVGGEVIRDGGSTEYLLGTDGQGRDILSRIVFSFRIPVILGAIGVLLGTIGSLALVWLGATGSAFKTSRQLPARGLLDFSLLRWAGVILTLSSSLPVFVFSILGTVGFKLAIVVCPLSAIVPLSLIYWSVRKTLMSPATRA